jgi:hypothetical protein
MRFVKAFALTPHDNCPLTSFHHRDELSDAREAEEA